MAAQDPREYLEMLIRERGEDYASLSRMIGRNSAYIQQFIKRGTPRKLDEKDRDTLARYFGIDQTLLGGLSQSLPVHNTAPAPMPIGKSSRASSFITIPQYDIRASAGHGAIIGQEQEEARIGFNAAWLRKLTGGATDRLSVIQVQGDSMAPTLSDGDDILVNSADGAERLRDGIYVLRREDILNVKRIALNPAGKGFSVRSDNPAYPAWDGVDLRDINIIGRVMWAGRKLV